MRLAVFDLDNTLLAGDSDYLWGKFLCDNGLVDAEAYEAANQAFYAAYSAGNLDADAYYRFSLQPLTQRSLAEWETLRARYVRDCITPVIAPRARGLLANHRLAGDTLLITTATQRFITEPIAALLDVPHLIAAEPAMQDGRFTGEMREGNFQGQKVTRLKAWIAQCGQKVDHITAYSDSRNDIPLLSLASQAVAVDPDPALREHAERSGWQMISLR